MDDGTFFGHCAGGELVLGLVLVRLLVQLALLVVLVLGMRRGPYQ